MFLLRAFSFNLILMRTVVEPNCAQGMYMPIQYVHQCECCISVKY